LLVKDSTHSLAVFGTQILFVAHVLEAKRRPVDAGLTPLQATRRAELAAQYTRVVMQAVLSLAVVGVSLWIITTSDNETAQKGAFTLLGTVLGYWLR
jgi:hypothetical protein